MTMRPLTEIPNLLNLSSRVECSRSSHSSASGSAKTVAASSKETPCFSRFLVAFRASQVNTIYVYTINIMSLSRVKRVWQRTGFKFCDAHWRLISFAQWKEDSTT